MCFHGIRLKNITANCVETQRGAYAICWSSLNMMWQILFCLKAVNDIFICGKRRVISQMNTDRMCWTKLSPLFPCDNALLLCRVTISQQQHVAFIFGLQKGLLSANSLHSTRGMEGTQSMLCGVTTQHKQTGNSILWCICKGHRSVCLFNLLNNGPNQQGIRCGKKIT